MAGLKLVYHSGTKLALSPSQLVRHTGSAERFTQMELIIIMLGIVLFDLAAVRWGHDSREGAHSAEAWFAAHGFSWGRGMRSGA
jgi:hypothetical protein